MNKTQQLLKSREEEFDKEFLEDGPITNAKYLNGYIDTTSDKIKSFHTTTILLLLNSLKEDLGHFTVYYRSKFSQDCSRNETEEEKNTEMIELSDISTLLSETISNIQTK